MLFQTTAFAALLVVTLVAFWAVPRARLAVLALANAVFYLAAGWQNLALFLAASAATYAIGRRVEGPGGRAWLAVGILANVANLLWFKYAGFAATTLHAWWPAIDPGWVAGVLLPIGISFYTFQHISYLVDRRVRGLASAPGYMHFWVYIAFFGHSIAGPIMRGHELFPQIAALPGAAFDVARARRGFELFLLGLAKKLVVADALAPRVGFRFENWWQLGAGDAWVAAVLFAFQIYYDFSAYSDMAVGIGDMFGLTLTQNFRTPYVAGDPREFWQRWHITLSRWIRDYVYIPLGGNRAGVGRGQLNLALAMLASGLWHGANWTFVCWGAYHAGLLLAHRAWSALRTHLGWRLFATRAYRLAAVAGFFALTCIGWVLFRAPDADRAFWLIGTMLHGRGPAFTQGLPVALLAGLVALHGLEFLLRERLPGLALWWEERVPSVVQGTAYAALVCALMVSYAGVQDFIYFRF